jgi:hypothetical protein
MAWGGQNAIPDSVRKSLSSDQLKALETEVEKAKKAADSDPDPWFAEAEAESATFASFGQLE